MNTRTAILACRELEAHLSTKKPLCHVALAGGALHKDGTRKDADVIIYCHNKEEEPATVRKWHALISRLLPGSGWEVTLKDPKNSFAPEDRNCVLLERGFDKIDLIFMKRP